MRFQAQYGHLALPKGGSGANSDDSSGNSILQNPAERLLSDSRDFIGDTVAQFQCQHIFDHATLMGHGSVGSKGVKSIPPTIQELSELCTKNGPATDTRCIFVPGVARAESEDEKLMDQTIEIGAGDGSGTGSSTNRRDIEEQKHAALVQRSQCVADISDEALLGLDHSIFSDSKQAVSNIVTKYMEILNKVYRLYLAEREQKSEASAMQETSSESGGGGATQQQSQDTEQETAGWRNRYLNRLNAAFVRIRYLVLGKTFDTLDPSIHGERSDLNIVAASQQLDIPNTSSGGGEGSSSDGSSDDNGGFSAASGGLIRVPQASPAEYYVSMGKTLVESGRTTWAKFVCYLKGKLKADVFIKTMDILKEEIPQRDQMKNKMVESNGMSGTNYDLLCDILEPKTSILDF